MLERCRLCAPRQHAGLDRLNLSIKIVALSGELIDLVVGGGQVDRLGEIDQSDEKGDQNGTDQSSRWVRPGGQARGARESAARLRGDGPSTIGGIAAVRGNAAARGNTAARGSAALRETDAWRF